MLGIIDCQIGNIGSLKNAFSYLGEKAEVITSPHDLKNCRAAILPGVGAFDPAMAHINSSGFAQAIVDFASSGKPLLGICLGMQILGLRSDEGIGRGLGLIKREIRSLSQIGCKGKVPHVGFNSVNKIDGDSPFLSMALNRDFYFVHSFAIEAHTTSPEQLDLAVALSEYEGVEFVSALHCKNIFGTQFHPEKSGELGLALLSEFLKCSRNA